MEVAGYVEGAVDVWGRQEGDELGRWGGDCLFAFER